jgi:hypothetical protein
LAGVFVGVAGTSGEESVTRLAPTDEIPCLGIADECPAAAPSVLSLAVSAGRIDEPSRLASCEECRRVFFPAVNPLFAKASIIVCTCALIIIQASLHPRSGEDRVVRSRKGSLEMGLLALTSLGFLLSLLCVATPVLAFADYPLRRVSFVAGILCLALGLWLHYRSHEDLGTSRSITLELQEGHQRVAKSPGRDHWGRCVA